MRRTIAAIALLLGLATPPALAHDEMLAGGDWVLQGQQGDQAPSLKFESGRVSGSGGCNQFGASYEQSGDSLSFSAIAATRMACKGPAMETERAFFDMLGRVTAMTLDGDTLTLRDGAGQALATLTRRMAQ